MKLQERFRDWTQPIYFLGQNPITLTGAVVTTSTALTTTAFWFYEVFLPGPPHPYIGLLVFLILPGIFILGLVMIPLGIWLRRRSLRERGELPVIFPAIDLGLPVVRRTLGYVALATLLNLLIVENIVPRRAVHGFDDFLRQDLSHRHGSGVHRLSEFSALACRLCRVPHRTRGGVVCALEGFWVNLGVRGNLPHLFAPHTFAGKVPSPGA
ncbi:MAG TPA: hypothetical protein VIX14_02175 [Terriglobales bacterium]